MIEGIEDGERVGLGTFPFGPSMPSKRAQLTTALELPTRRRFPSGEDDRLDAFADSRADVFICEIVQVDRIHCPHSLRLSSLISLLVECTRLMRAVEKLEPKE